MGTSTSVSVLGITARAEYRSAGLRDLDALEAILADLDRRGVDVGRRNSSVALERPLRPPEDSLDELDLSEGRWERLDPGLEPLSLSVLLLPCPGLLRSPWRSLLPCEGRSVSSRLRLLLRSAGRRLGLGGREPRSLGNRGKLAERGALAPVGGGVR